MMTPAATGLDAVDWPHVGRLLEANGYALLPGLLACAPARLDPLDYPGHAAVTTTDPGHGDLHCFAAGLPEPLASLRQRVYPHLVPIANRWNETLAVDYRYPATLAAFLARCREAGQVRQISHLSRLRESNYLALHQRREGAHVFPLQLVGLLSEPGQDFTGGEFIMTEQRPRMQSRPIVLPLRQGDAALIVAAHRPAGSSANAYRVNFRHAIGRVRSGVRIGVELSFHDSP